MAFIFNIFKKKEKSWQFDTKEEAIKKLTFLKKPETYEIVRNRACGKLAPGWILRTKIK